MNIEGGLVRIRDWREDDLPVYRGWLEPHHEWHDWDGPYFPVPDAGEADRLVSALAATVGQSVADTRTPSRAVIADRVTDELVGTVSWYYESEVSDWRRIGITVFDPRHRGRGMGLEALSLWADHLFGTTAIRRLDLATWSGNTAMCRVAHRAGWLEEARFRDARLVRGAVYDGLVFGITRDDWQRLHAAPGLSPSAECPARHGGTVPRPRGS